MNRRQHIRRGGAIGERIDALMGPHPLTKLSAEELEAKRAEVLRSVQNLGRYRDFTIEHVWPPIPFRGWDWQAAHVNYDPTPTEPDGPAGDNRIFHAASREALIALIDEWHEEQADPALAKAEGRSNV